jgi:hypothetical protein
MDYEDVMETIGEMKVDRPGSDIRMVLTYRKTSG